MVAAPAPPWLGPRGGAWRFALLSLLLHAVAAFVLWRHGPWPIATGAGTASARPTTVADAQRQREARTEARAREIEALARRAAGQPAARDGARSREARPEAPAAAASATPLARIQQAAQALESRDRAQRAEELSRLLRIPIDEARARVAAEMPRPTPEPRDEAAALAQWEQRAQEAAQRLEQRAERQTEGAQIQPGHAEPSGGPAGSAADRVAGPAGDPNGPRTGNARTGGSGGGASTGSGPSARNGRADGAAPPLEGPSGFADPRRYAPDATTAADARALTPVSRARRVGAGGPTTGRIVLDRWYVAGPFDADGPRDLTRRVYPPELSVDLDAVYEGQGGRLLRWQWSDQPGYPFVPQPRRENAVYFAYTELVVDQAQDVWLDLGVDDDARLWLNDALVWTSGPESKPWYRQPYYTLRRDIDNRSLVEASQRVRLKAGRNRLLLKLYNGIDLMFFSVVVRR